MTRPGFHVYDGRQDTSAQRSPPRAVSEGVPGDRERPEQRAQRGKYVRHRLAGHPRVVTGIVTAANAGHEYPILRKPDGQFEVFKDKHGIVLGAIPHKKYSFSEMSRTTSMSLWEMLLSSTTSR